MKIYIRIFIFIVSLSGYSAFSQGTENFDNFTGDDEVRSGSFTGNSSITWNYTNCRGDKDRMASFTTSNSEKGFKSVAQQFSLKGCAITQTDQYVAPPDPQYNVTTKEWHLTASYGPSMKNRILTVIQLTHDGTSPAAITKLGEGYFQCGDWSITAELNGDNPVRLNIRNESKNVTFSLGSDNPIINGVAFQRQHSGSSILYDEIEGTKKTVEIVDRPAQPTR